MILATILAAQLFVTNERAGTVQIIDTTTDRVVATSKIHDRPRGLALSPDGKRLYVAVSWWRDGKRPRSGRERIAALDARTLKPVRDYVAGTDPECVTVGPDGQRLYLSNEDAGTASIIDVASGKHLATLVVGTEPEGVTATPTASGSTSPPRRATCSPSSTQKRRRPRPTSSSTRVRAPIFTRDSKFAWATAEIGGTVQLIDTAKRRILKRIKLRPQDKPVGLVLAPDEKRLYVATGRGNAVAVIDTKTHKVLATIPTGERVWGIAITPDGRKVYAANSLGNTISVIDTRTHKVVRAIGTDDGPWGLVMRD